ncbi:MAG: protein-tyrosine-phosphatase [Devosiaceae bacterium]|nr:protein-tyrosine-phosphatase [Devosiaceae bacterium]
MAAALARLLFPGKLISRSAGARSGQADGFVHAAMEELGIDMSVHTPHTMDELVATRFDMVITLSNEASEAVAFRKIDAKMVEHWPTEDPTLIEGSREIRLAAYHQLRDGLKKQIIDRLTPILPD